MLRPLLPKHGVVVPVEIQRLVRACGVVDAHVPVILAVVRTPRDVLVRLGADGDAAPGGGVGAVAGEGDGGEGAAPVEEACATAAVAVGAGERGGVGVDVGDGEVAGGGGFGEGEEGADVAGEGMGLVEDAHFVCVVGLFGIVVGRMSVGFVGEVQILVV